MLYTQPNDHHKQQHRQHQQQQQHDRINYNDLHSRYNMHENSPVNGNITGSELHIGPSSLSSTSSSSSSSSSPLPLSFATPHTPPSRSHSHNPSQIPSQITAPASQISTPLPPQDHPTTSLDKDMLTTPNPHLTTHPTTHSTTNNNVSTSGYPNTTASNASMSPFSILCGSQRDLSQNESRSRNGKTGGGGNNIGGDNGSRSRWSEGGGGGVTRSSFTERREGNEENTVDEKTTTGTGTGHGSLYSTTSFSNTAALKNKLLSSRSMIPKPREQFPSQNTSQNTSQTPSQTSAPTSQTNP